MEPCGNDDCDICHPIPRWLVSTTSVRRQVHEREIKAATVEEALAIYARGTSWPESYDERSVEVLESTAPVAVLERAKPDRWRCYHHINDPDRFEDPKDGLG